MKLIEIERIQTGYKNGNATTQEVQSVLDEAVKFHHKVSQLQEMLLLIKKQCQLEMTELEGGKEVTGIHFEMFLEYLVKVVVDTQHIKAA